MASSSDNYLLKTLGVAMPVTSRGSDLILLTTNQSPAFSVPVYEGGGLSSMMFKPASY